jgi:hypothetical protein
MSDTQAALHTVMPDEGYVPDAETAAAIAVAVLRPIYGAEAIERQLPFHATLSNDIWTVTGSLPPRRLGGTANAQISKRDGRVLRVSHGR